MRKIIEYCLVSADGIVLDDPFPFGDYLDDVYLRDRLGLFAVCDAMLFGRTTYERFAKRWAGSGETRPYAARLNAIRKYVFSSRLETAEWGNATIVRGDVAAEAIKLKQQDGGDLLILGHGLLGETLLKHRLIDVLDLAIHPVVVGHGKPFFREGQAENSSSPRPGVSRSSSRSLMRRNTDRRSGVCSANNISAAAIFGPGQEPLRNRIE